MGWRVINYAYCENITNAFTPPRNALTDTLSATVPESQLQPQPSCDRVHLGLRVYKLRGTVNSPASQAGPRLPCAALADTVPFSRTSGATNGNLKGSEEMEAATAGNRQHCAI